MNETIKREIRKDNKNMKVIRKAISNLQQRIPQIKDRARKLFTNMTNILCRFAGVENANSDRKSQELIIRNINSEEIPEITIRGMHIAE